MQTQREDSSMEVKELAVCCHKPKDAWGHQKLGEAREDPPLGGSLPTRFTVLACSSLRKQIPKVMVSFQIELRVHLEFKLDLAGVLFVAGSFFFFSPRVFSGRKRLRLNPQDDLP